MPTSMNEYTDVDRSFLQCFIAQRTFTSNEALKQLEILTEIENSGTSLSQDDLQTSINKINKSIEPFNLSIIKTKDELSKNTFYFTLINKLSNQISQLATTLTPNEIDFFKIILDQIFVGDQHTLQRDQFWIQGSKLSACAKIQTKNLDEQRINNENEEEDTEDGRRITVVTMKPLTHTEYISLLETLEEESWLNVTTSSPTGTKRISPSPRLLAELKPYLIYRYSSPESQSNEELTIPRHNHLRFCIACKNIFTQGKQCSTNNCETRLHISCEEAFYRHNSNSSSCPSCQSDLQDSNIIGPTADSE